MLSACFDDLAPTRSIAASLNGKPTISGDPPTSIHADLAYDFTPTASDPNGDALDFRVSNKPSWAHFDSTTGRLSGTPRAGDVGISADIRISVSDGKVSAALPKFGIKVNQISVGSATLTWLPPTLNADGSTLTDLAGYRIYYGRRADTLDQVITIDNPGITAYLVENLSRATWYFSMTALNSSGVESQRSATASKSVS